MNAIERLLPHEPSLEVLYHASLLESNLDFQVETEEDRAALQAAVLFAYDSLIDALSEPGGDIEQVKRALNKQPGRKRKL